MGNVFLHDQTNRYVGIVGVNGQIVVSCPSGCNVRIVCGDAEYTAVADETGKVTFTGLTHGIWTVEVDNGRQTITKNVEIITDYEVDMEFITADIRIDYPYGSKCTCTNGVVEYTAPDTSGNWDLIVSDAGIWTITCTNGIRTETIVVDISYNGQVESVVVTYFEAAIRVQMPVEASCTCTNGSVHYITPDYSNVTTIDNIVHEFKVCDAGTWELTCVKDGRTETRVVEIVSDGQSKSVIIKFFEATLDITYSAGCYCTCTNGSIKYISPDTSGSWTCTIPDSGTWTVSCSNNGLTKSETVEMSTDGEVKTVDIDKFMAMITVLYPEGNTCNIVSNGETYSAPDTSGTWYFTCSSTGTYEVTCVTDAGSKSKTVDITDDWQIERISLTDFEAYIEITYPAGATCICYNDTNTTRIKAPNTSGSWTLLVPSAGAWTVEASNTEQTVSSIVTVTGDGHHTSTTIKFFAATINITYPAGATCTCTDGTTMYQDPENSGYWVLTVPRKNEWLIQVSLNGKSISGSVIITEDGQVIDKTVKFFQSYINITYPVGASCICVNGNDTYYAPDTGGSWTVTVPRTGTWEIKAELEEQVCSGTVEITADEQVVNKKIKFFAATINVTYPAGSVCTCTSSDGTTTYTAPDTSGSWTITVLKADKWLIEAEGSEQTVSNTAEIVEDEQVVDVTVKFFEAYIHVDPRGAYDIVTCSDGITTYEDIGTAMFKVPRVGKWTVTASNDSIWIDTISKSKVVDITYDGQSIYVDELEHYDYASIRVSYSYLDPVHTAIVWKIDSNNSKTEIYTSTRDSEYDTGFAFPIYGPGDYEIGAYHEAPYDGIESNTGKYYSTTVNIYASDVIDNVTKSITPVYKYLPTFTYSGDYEIVDDHWETISSDDDISDASIANKANIIGNWNIKFLTTGVLNFTELNGAGEGVDVFVCGGGGNGGEAAATRDRLWGYGGGGGAGGYRNTEFGIPVHERNSYKVVIGGPGGSSSAFNVSADGGSNGTNANRDDKTVGTGGAGGSRGGNGGGYTSDGNRYRTKGETGSYAFMGTSGIYYGTGGNGGYGAYIEERLPEPTDLCDHTEWIAMQNISFQDDEIMDNSGHGGHGGRADIDAAELCEVCNQFISVYFYAYEPSSGASGIVIIRNKR